MRFSIFGRFVSVLYFNWLVAVAFLCYVLINQTHGQHCDASYWLLCPSFPEFVIPNTPRLETLKPSRYCTAAAGHHSLRATLRKDCIAAVLCETAQVNENSPSVLLYQLYVSVSGSHMMKTKLNLLLTTLKGGLSLLTLTLQNDCIILKSYWCLNTFQFDCFTNLTCPKIQNGHFDCNNTAADWHNLHFKS